MFLKKQYDPPKRRYLPSNSHGLITKETNIDIFTAMRTLDVTLFLWRALAVLFVFTNYSVTISAIFL
jgi:hypothetical protein